MPTRSSIRWQIVAAFSLALVSACGSSDTGQDSGGGGAKDGPNRDAAAGPDTLADAPADMVDGWAGTPDATAAPEASAELPRLDLGRSPDELPTIDLAGINPDGPQPRLDLAASAEAGATEARSAEAPQPAVDSPSGADGAGDSGDDLGASGRDDTADAIPAAEPDVPADAAEAPFDPGPATPIVVNSGNTGVYNLADGTWKVFYFDTEAGQMYVLSGLDGITRGYLGTSPSVSPSAYQMATDRASGTLLFTAATAGRYYLAVGVTGGGASGSFQVADGGKAIPLGTTTLSLTPADAGDGYYVYRFPISAGHGYSLTLQGLGQPELAFSVGPRPERSGMGGLSYSIWGVGGGLPFNNEEIPATSVADSTSGYYFIDFRITDPITFSIAITELS